MLPHVGRHQRLPLGQPPDVMNHVRRVQVPLIRKMSDVAHGGVSLHRFDVGKPGTAVTRIEVLGQGRQRVAEVPGDADVSLDVLVDLGGVDVDVDLPGVSRVGREIAGHAIVESHPQRDQQVGFLNGVVDPSLAVHSHHAQAQRMARREGPQPEQRERHGRCGAFRKGAQFRRSAALDDPMAGEDDRLARLVNELCRACQLLFARRATLHPARSKRGVVPLPVDACLLGVFRDVDEHRAGPARSREKYRLAQRRHDVRRARHQVVVFRDRQGDAGHVGLLEGVVPDQVTRHLAVMQTRGTESIIAVAMPVTRLVAPGPEVARTTPMPPVARAYPSAICVAPCS